MEDLIRERLALRVGSKRSTNLRASSSCSMAPWLAKLSTTESAISVSSV